MSDIDNNLDIDLDELDDFIGSAQEEVEPKAAKEAESTENESVELDLTQLEEIEEEISEEQSVADAAPLPKKTVAKKEAKKPTKTGGALKFNASDDLVKFAQQSLDGKKLILQADDGDSDVENNLEGIQKVAPVKVREKLANLISWYSGKKELSRYTMSTLKLLSEKGQVSKADLRNNLLDSVGPGTASSQAGQMTHLLTSVRAANYVDGKFVANEDSVVLQLVKLQTDSDAA